MTPCPKTLIWEVSQVSLQSLFFAVFDSVAVFTSLSNTVQETKLYWTFSSPRADSNVHAHQRTKLVNTTNMRIITTIKLLSLDRSLREVGASTTHWYSHGTWLLWQYHHSRFLTYHLYASTHNTLSSYNLVTRTKFSINLLLLLLFARLPTRHHQQDKNFLPEYMLEAPENLFVLNICILPYLDDIVVLFYYSRTTS